MYQRTYICLYDDAIGIGEHITSNDSANGELEEISNDFFKLSVILSMILRREPEKSTTLVSQGQ